MAEFEGGADTRREGLEKRIEQRRILLEVRRELKQHRPELRAERRCGLEKLPHQIAAIAQPAVVRDPPGGFQRQLEPLRGGLIPPVENLLVRRAIERVVDLDGWEPFSVIGQHLRRRQLLRIEAALPFGIVVAGGADPEAHSRCRSPRTTETRRTRSDNIPIFVPPWPVTAKVVTV